MQSGYAGRGCLVAVRRICLVAVTALCCAAASRARAQSRVPGAGDYQNSREESLPAQAAPAVAASDDIDLVGPTKAQKERAIAASRAQAEAEAKVHAEAEAKLRVEAEAKLRVEAEAKAQAEVKLRIEAETKADAEAKLRADAEATARADAEARARAPAADERAGAPEAANAVAVTSAAVPSTPCLARADAKGKKRRHKKRASAPCLVQAVPLPTGPLPSAATAASAQIAPDSDELPLASLTGGAPSSRRVIMTDSAPAAPAATAIHEAAPELDSLHATSPARANDSSPQAQPVAIASAAQPVAIPAGATRSADTRLARADLPADRSTLGDRRRPWSPAAGEVIPREGGARNRSVAVQDDVLVGPVGLTVNQLTAAVEVMPNAVQAELGWRFAIDDATAAHQTFQLGLRSRRCQDDAPCAGTQWFARGSLSPNASAQYGVARMVGGQSTVQADQLGWSGGTLAAGLAFRASSGLLVGLDSQYESLALGYLRDSRSNSAAATSANLNQLRVRGTLGGASGAFSGEVSAAGYAYLGDGPDSTHGMPLRGALIDDGVAGLAGAPQGFLVRADGRYEFSFGLAAALSYGYLGYAGTDWSGAQIASARLSQRLGRFELGLGLAFQLDAPSTLPPGASASDYGSMYGVGTAAARF